jgi:hypothetical protein
LRLAKARIIVDYEVKEKILILLGHAFDIGVTGVAIWIVVNWWGSIISYGLAAFLAVYYFDLLVTKVKS